MDVVHKCKLLPPYDAVFLLDREKNLANVTGALFFEPFEFEMMKNYILEKTKVVNWGRSKLVQKYGLWFFQEMEDEEWNQKKHYTVVLKEGIHTDDELTKFMLQEQLIRDPYENT